MVDANRLLDLPKAKEVALGLGIGGGVLIERQAVVRPCVRALDAYHDAFEVVTEFIDTSEEVTRRDLFAMAHERYSRDTFRRDRRPARARGEALPRIEAK